MSALTLLAAFPAASAASPTLTYSHHAIERALARKLPILSCLPPEATQLADRDTGGTVYKVSEGGDGFYVILSDDNVVVTTFRKQDEAEWRRWTEARQKRRERDARGITSTGASAADASLQEVWKAEYAACRLIKSAFSDAGRERFETRLARRFLRPAHPRSVRAGQMRLLRQAEKEGIGATRQGN